MAWLKVSAVLALVAVVAATEEIHPQAKLKPNAKLLPVVLWHGMCFQGCKSTTHEIADVLAQWSPGNRSVYRKYTHVAHSHDHNFVSLHTALAE